MYRQWLIVLIEGSKGDPKGCRERSISLGCDDNIVKQLAISISIAAPPPKLEDVSEMLMPASSPLMLPATLPAGVIVRGFPMAIGCVPVDDGLNAKGPSSASSSSLGLSSRVTSSCPASSGYRPRSANVRGVRGWAGSSETDATSRWNAASDLSSASSGRDSANKFRMRGCLSCIHNISSAKNPVVKYQLTGKESLRLKIVGMSAPSMLADDLRRGGVNGGCRVGFAVASGRSSSLPGGALSGGVCVSELLGESVIILSLSLSDSSVMKAV